ncbi:hypothetical protein AC578_1054 [Pseudocercospora eumusae]|uniref:Uncharacterized protein n=1 Tax=Pseudocercospora eumusae TaxID=321146 RepID=A0A139HTY7_9PEZI|nr:hypothetical protein AC578_1054 [Pseudocercospora eumusae]
MARSNGIEGALYPTTLSDMNHMKLLADPYRQSPLTAGHEHACMEPTYGSSEHDCHVDMYDYGLSNRATLVPGGPGFPQRRNYYGGGYGVMDGIGTSWGVDPYDAMNPRFHDLSHGL